MSADMNKYIDNFRNALTSEELFDYHVRKKFAVTDHMEVGMRLILSISEQFPNDADLGEQIRKLYWLYKEADKHDEK